jgi:hypothetical protein
VSLIARHLEEHGIPTVIMGCAKDIVEQAGVPRFLFSDFPLGNSAGKPNDPSSQTRALNLALSLFDTATEPGTTVTNPEFWADDEGWKHHFMNIDALSAERIEELKADFAAQKETAKRIKQAGQ